MTRQRLLIAMICLQALMIVAVAAAPAEDEFRFADTTTTVTRALFEGGSGLRTWLRCGPDGVQIALQTREGGTKPLTLRVFDASLPSAGATPVTLKAAGFEVPELRVRRYLRPNPALLKPQAREALLKEWDKLPSPLTRPVELKFTQAAEGVECYLDGLYAGKPLTTGRLASVAFTLPPGSAIGRSQGIVPLRPRLLPLDLGGLGGAKDLPKDAISPNRTDLPIASPETGVDLDLGLTARQADVYTEYTNRSAFDGLTDSFITTVPSAQYIRAWVLCALEDDPAKDTAFTARLTRFVSGGPYTGRARECLADTTVTLPRKPSTDGPPQVGTVSLGGKQLPLYLVDVPLRSGDIQDLIFEETPQRGTANIGPYLDFELLGRLRPQDRPHPFGDGRYLPDSRRVSGVHVFGVTLEETPVEMQVRQTQPGNVFTAGEKPELSVALRPRVSGSYQLRWTIRDADGKRCWGGGAPVFVKANDPEQTVSISLDQPQLGWYEITCELLQGERLLLTHNASFALLAADTRQAGFESPYATWWFDHHYGTADAKTIGPLLLKGGFRRAAYGVARHNEAELAPWKVTAASVPWGGISDPKLTDEQIETAIRKTVDAYPSVGNILLFHESLSGPLGTRTAPELLGLPIKEHPGSDERWARVTRVARIVRDKFPQLKIYIGNSGASSELIAEGLRRKFPPQLADYVGVEAVGRTGVPEKLWEGGQQGVWFLREIARQYGYRWKPTSCYEANYREDRLIGEQRQAEWYVRDLLIGHAYRFPYISIALLADTGNSYNGSFWGATGLCHRFPLLYPKRAYVAMAVATQVLDRVTLRREVPTGSNCVYALDFQRGDGKNTYPLWTARGTCALNLTFKNAPKVELTDFYGRTRTLPTNAGKLSLTAGTAAQYVVTSGTLTSITCGKRTYPEDQPSASFKVASRMADADQWQLRTASDPLLEQTQAPHLPFRTAGRFDLRGAKDPEKGSCLEVELLSRQQPATPLLSEYCVLRLKTPIALPGQPTTLGLWAKGNSGWGQVYFEIEDAAGVRRISCGTAAHDADVFDYDGRVSLNFDGWNFLSFPITDASPIPDLSTGSVGNLWEATDRSKPVTYPLKLTGVAISVPQQTLHLTEMVPVKQIIRLRDVGTID